MSAIPPNAPGLQYPALGSNTPIELQSALRNIFDNLFYLRQLFDMVEEGVGDALGLPARRPR